MRWTHGSRQARNVGRASPPNSFSGRGRGMGSQERPVKLSAAFAAGALSAYRECCLHILSVGACLYRFFMKKMEDTHMKFENIKGSIVAMITPFHEDGSVNFEVLTNLLENAVLHAEGMTHLTLRVFTLGRRAVFEVIDNGCGIPNEQLKRLFSGTTLAQDTSSSGRHGMGIGLSVCAAIIKAHGGEIKAESTPGEGTTIRFWLETEEVDTEETEDEQ